MKCQFLWVLFWVLMVAPSISCHSFSNEKMFKSLSKDKTGIDFENTLNYKDSLSVLDFEYMFNGAGVALLDVNKDGLTDVFFTGNYVSARLYLNKGNMKFEDITAKAGLETQGWCYGASVVDINQDGYPDIYISKAGSRGTPPEKMHNLFFINNGPSPSPKGEGRGEVTFTESAAKMGLDDDGYDIHAAFLDYDHDGDLDMYLLRNSFVNYNRNTARMKQIDGGAPSTDKLFRNNGFTPSPEGEGRGKVTFTDVSKEAGITIEGFGLGVNVCDLNNDNWPDVYVSNDFLTNNLIWINNRNGTFTNMADKMLRHTTYNAMGNDIADFNNDGKEDIVEVDMLPPDNKRWKLNMMGNTYDQFQQSLGFGYQPQYVRNSLQLNNGPSPFPEKVDHPLSSEGEGARRADEAKGRGSSPSPEGESRGEVTFSEIGQLAGISATEWSWAPLLADFDNDGLKDLFITNGYRQDITNLDFIVYGKRALFMGTPEANRKDRIDKLNNFEGIKVPNYLFKNNGNLTFSNVAADWGLEEATYSNGAAYGDLDNDGDLDLVINNLDQPATVYENQSNKLKPAAKWLRVDFKGPKGNVDGLGAKVYTWQGANMQYQYYSPYRGYLSTVEPYLHFGFPDKPVDSIKVIWPDGKEQVLKSPPLNKSVTLNYNNAYWINSKPSSQYSLLFTDCSKDDQIQYKHQEDEFVDFKIQPLVPHMLSHEGPGISVGDVNGDDLEDFFVGAAAGAKASIFIQKKNGTFAQRPLADSNVADNMGALFFDADNDGDQDLYVVSGGVCAKKNGDSVYQPHFYLNDGKCDFILEKDAVPQINTSCSAVIAADYDHDGDLDLFVGGRVSPGEYPYAPKSYLLRNDAAPTTTGPVKFTDVTHRVCSKLAGIGMVTSALWTDYDNDGWQDLIIAGEFMPITFIKNEKGKRFSSPQIIEHSQGWWNGLVAGDFDNDGDIDYVAGNRGLNGPYEASSKEPICIYARDYDKNGRLDPIMCHFENGNEYIVHSRDDINKQITAMRARFRDYSSYATVTFKEAFRPDEISDAYVVRCETFSSAYIENLGNGKFTLHDLPLEAQFAPVYGMVTKDFDGDGNLDVLCVGNSYATEVQTGRYDAQGSFLLTGNGKGKFAVNRKEINVIGDNKAIAEIRGANGSSKFLISSNSDSLHSYRLNQPRQKIVSISPDDTYANITLRNGMKCRQEFYFGSSYLSQSSRRLTISSNIQSVVIYNSSGKKRELSF